MTRSELLSSSGYHNAQFSIAIYEAMKSAKLTQKQLAVKVGISQPFISQLINGEKSASIETFCGYNNGM